MSYPPPGGAPYTTGVPVPTAHPGMMAGAGGMPYPSPAAGAPYGAPGMVHTPAFPDHMNIKDVNGTPYQVMANGGCGRCMGGGWEKKHMDGYD